MFLQKYTFIPFSQMKQKFQYHAPGNSTREINDWMEENLGHRVSPGTIRIVTGRTFHGLYQRVTIPAKKDNKKSSNKSGISCIKVGKNAVYLHRRFNAILCWHLLENTRVS